MTIHNVVVDVQMTTLHVVSAGLTLTSIAGALGYVPVIIAGIAGLAAIISYTFATLDSPTFQKWFFKSTPPTK